MKGRTYRYIKQDALYPFGYGLSYTSFEYSNLTLSAETIPAGESVACSVLVKNRGEREADETVQLYLKDMDASVETPNWKLAGIRTIHLEPGETKQVKFSVAPLQMALIDEEGRCILEPGVFEVYLGGSQPDRRSRELTGNTVPAALFEVFGDKMELEC